MPEPFKNLLNAALVMRMGVHLQRVWPRFDAARFCALGVHGLDSLEMKARAMQIADALEATLPASFARAANVVEQALAPAWPDDRLDSDDPCRDGLEGWALWPVGEWVARRGLAQPDRALQVLHAVTQRFTAEWAIRPFILAHPALAFPTLQRWATDPSAHVRRLVSEGSRPRLPWGMRLKPLVADPTPTWPLLAALQDDASEYVRRSVANHLNDIAKDHPALVVDWIGRQLVDAPPPRVALLRHASRTLIKAGDAGMLAVWGLGAALCGSVRMRISPKRLALGGTLTLDVRLQSRAPHRQRLLIDYAVHHLKANGSHSPKVFKGGLIELGPGETRQWVKRHPVRPITTRRYRAGRQLVDLRINGQVVAQTLFTLSLGNEPTG